MGAQPKSSDLTSSIVRALEEDILLGRRHPRERLVEDDLAREFDVKRHVARQALSELEVTGVLVRQPGKGVMIREYSAEEVDHLYAVRELVEGQAARLIPLPVAAADLVEIEAICQTYADAVAAFDLRRVIDANKRFHQAVFRLCGNPFLSDIIDDCAQKANLVRFVLNTDRDFLARARQEHYGILEALKGTDTEELARRCIGHMQPARRRYQEIHGGISRIALPR